MIDFHNPEMLLLLIIVPLIIIIHFVSLHRFKRKVFKFANYETLKRISDKKNIVSYNIFHLILRVIFAVTLILAVAGTSLVLEQEGYQNNAIFAIDTSGSMLADDVDPTRLDAAKQAVSGFIEYNLSRKTKAGLISFTSVAYKENPLTFDRLELLSAVEDIETRKTSGTSIGAAISFADSLTEEENTEMVIISDGQENILTDEEIDDIIEETDMKINIIGIGTIQGAPFTNSTAGRSVLNEEELERIAEKAEGSYYHVNSAEMLQDTIEQALAKGEVERKYDISLYIFLFGFLILIFEWYFANYLSRFFP